MIEVSIISPVYNAEVLISELISRIEIEISKITEHYEIILVEDGSDDNGWNIIKENCNRNLRIKGVKLSRNFGQHNAIAAGINEANGNFAIIMDCDLQDNPIYFREMYHSAKIEGYDVVYTKKFKREHGKLKNLTAWLYNLVFNWLIDNKKWAASDNVGNYSIISKKVIDAYKTYKDYKRHYLIVLRWLGFNSNVIEIKHEKRLKGKSSYTLRKLLSHSIDGITSQSDKLLKFTVQLGLLLSMISFLSGIYIVVNSFFHSYQSGWASIVVLLFFITGLIITSIGISAIYIGKIFEQTKQRPLYIIDEKIN